MWFCCCLIQCHYSLLDTFYDLFRLLKMKRAKLQLPTTQLDSNRRRCVEVTWRTAGISHWCQFICATLISTIGHRWFYARGFCWRRHKWELILRRNSGLWWMISAFKVRNYLKCVLSASPVWISRLRTSRATHKSPAKPTWHRRGNLPIERSHFLNKSN